MQTYNSQQIIYIYIYAYMPACLGIVRVSSVLKRSWMSSKQNNEHSRLIWQSDDEVVDTNLKFPLEPVNDNLKMQFSHSFNDCLVDLFIP